MISTNETATKKVKSILINSGGDKDQYYAEVTYLTKIGSFTYEETLSYFGSDFDAWYSSWISDKFLYQEYFRSKGVEAPVDESDGTIANG